MGYLAGEKVMLGDFFSKRRVLITGHTGFKGSWLWAWMKMSGAELAGYSLAPKSDPALFNVLGFQEEKNSKFADILDAEKLDLLFENFKPEIVFHMAAQPLVRLSYSQPSLTYKTNVIGTLNVLEAARKCGSVRAFVNVTTDKCYENKEVFQAYEEDSPMGGYDMYSSSKACAEILSASYRRSFLSDGFCLATARAGNVIGGGDWAEDRLIPDCVRSINAKRVLEIRNPDSIRPWQHVLEPLSGYMNLAKKLCENGVEFAEAFNFGPEENETFTVKELVESFLDVYGKGEMQILKRDSLHEANLLRLSINKAKARLNWRPIYSAGEAVKKTAHWYREFYLQKDMRSVTESQIEEFESSYEKR